jgi:hypothetical protein
MDSVTIPLKTTYHDAISRQRCASCEKTDCIAKGMPRYDVWFEDFDEVGLKINSLSICQDCYECAVAEYVEFCCYDWSAIWFRFGGNNTTLYRFDSRFRCND